ncbi:MAG TPA: TonB family protein [Myxococcales bacterium]|nr:TonB family protein [Myxococcales bacterium]
MASAVQRAAVPLGTAIALHLIAGLILLRLSVVLPTPPAPKQVVQFDVVVKPPAPVEKPPEPVKAPEPPKPVPLKITRAPKIIPKDVPPPSKAPIPETKAPPPPTKEAPATTPVPVIITGITLESTSQGGSMAVGTGNTLQGTPGNKAAEPAQVKPYKAEQYAPAAQVTELPRVLNGDSVNLRKYYPAEAQREGFEGDVVLRLLIDSDGSIAKADIISDPGHQLGASALRAIRAEYRFAPAKVNGVAVATTVPFTIHFTIPD